MRQMSRDVMMGGRRLDVTRGLVVGEGSGGWGWGWGGRTQEELEGESMDLKAVSGPRGCRSRCCPPSLWPSSV